MSPDWVGGLRKSCDFTAAAIEKRSGRKRERPVAKYNTCGVQNHVSHAIGIGLASVRTARFRDENPIVAGAKCYELLQHSSWICLAPTRCCHESRWGGKACGSNRDSDSMVNPAVESKRVIRRWNWFRAARRFRGSPRTTRRPGRAVRPTRGGPLLRNLRYRSSERRSVSQAASKAAGKRPRSKTFRDDLPKPFRSNFLGRRHRCRDHRKGCTAHRGQPRRHGCT